MTTAKELGLASCHVCSRLSDSSCKHCSRCGAPLHVRKVNSIQRCWSLLITAALLFIPAMMFPVTVITAVGQVDASTLMESVVHFLKSGAWPIGLVIFIASIVVPLLKIIGLGFLLFSVQRKTRLSRLQLTKLYRMVELVGRWSMIDVFVVAILVALVQVGTFITILPGTGILAFTGVVIITMLAAMQFDPRLIWDTDKNE